jgi:hypothetical protein
MSNQITPHEAAAFAIQHIALARQFFALLEPDQYPTDLKYSILGVGVGLAFAESAVNSHLQQFSQEALVDSTWQEVDF